MNIQNKRLVGGLLACLLTVFAMLTVRAMSVQIQRDKDAKPASVKQDGTPVIVELFTSEGCSSCPSADAVLADLKRSQPVHGARILVLSEHVDYWNSIGWHDPFSAPAFTARQYEYGRKFRLNSVYTPQAVVDGQAEMVGSERENVQTAIERSARTPKAEVVLAAEADMPNKVRVMVRRPAGGDVDVMLAITEDNLSSNVARGENAGRKLAHVGVVRSLRKIGSLSGRDPFTATALLELQSGWKRADLEAVVFVQECVSRRIVGANSLRLDRE